MPNCRCGSAFALPLGRLHCALELPRPAFGPRCRCACRTTAGCARAHLAADCPVSKTSDTAHLFPVCAPPTQKGHHLKQRAPEGSLTSQNPRDESFWQLRLLIAPLAE